MNNDKFILTSEECELLLAFEMATNLESLAELVGRDISNVSRAINRMSARLPVVEKSGKKWVLTAQGRELIQHTRDSIHFQRALFQKQASLRIGTNREFAARVLGENLDKLRALFPDTQLRISAFEAGVEDALISGTIDLGIDCERPLSPDISYRSIVKEPIIAVCSPAFRKKHASDWKKGNFFSLPHLLCDRLSPDKIMNKSDNQLNVLASFNDIATTRRACEKGAGWALLPSYAVRLELESGTLEQIPSAGGGESNYGVWWLRGRKYLGVSAENLQGFLRKVDL
ncbi:MAG: LysR family transcriptional regulator [Bdellovibrionaceae bacterium]|nr:LysR family transcriptional regulator [Pseudobdellovibrionaceae bacterium]